MAKRHSTHRVHVREHHRSHGRRHNPKILGMNTRTLLIVGALAGGAYYLSKRQKMPPAPHGSSVGSGRGAAPGSSFSGGVRAPGFGGRPFYAMHGDGDGGASYGSTGSF